MLRPKRVLPTAVHRAGIILSKVNELSMPDDATLMRRVAQGDRRAFLHLYDKYAPRVNGLSLRMLRDEMTAEEVTQDAFLRLWTRATTFNPDRGRLLSWLLAITRRLAIDRIRLDARRPALSEANSPGKSWEQLPDAASQTEEARWLSMKFALFELPAEQREAIELAFYHGMSHGQIAEYLELPLGTVKTRLRLAMEKLRRSLQIDPIEAAQRR